MPSFNRIKVLEKWIEFNEHRGKLSVFAILCVEDNQEDFYKVRVEGIKYKQFSIYRELSGYRVTHLHTGGRCGGSSEPFSSEREARRAIFCLSGLLDWKEVKWTDNKSPLNPFLQKICREAVEYCLGIPGEYVSLVEAVKKLLPEDEEDLTVTTEAVGFGLREPKDPKKDAGDSLWGTAIT